LRQGSEVDLITGFRLEVTSPPCEPGAERYNAFVHLNRDISEAFPFLNAVWPGAIYDQRSNSLSCALYGHHVVLHPLKIAVGGFEDRVEAEAVVRRIVADINAVWARRQSILPRYDSRRRPNALAIYRLLPGSNCKACGEGTCFVFAAKLAAGLVDLEKCQALAEPEHVRARQELERMLSGVA